MTDEDSIPTNPPASGPISAVERHHHADRKRRQRRHADEERGDEQPTGSASALPLAAAMVL